jgi:hypothetical protein
MTEEKTNEHCVAGACVRARPYCCVHPVVVAAPLVPSQRLMLAGMGFLAFMMVYACRVNLSVAIVCMVKVNKTTNASSLVPVDETPLSEVRAPDQSVVYNLYVGHIAARHA